MTARDSFLSEARTPVVLTSPRREAALSFLRGAAAGKAREVFGIHVAAEFRHHNAFFQGDANSLMTAMEKNARENPHKTLDVKQILEDGDLVAILSHVKMKPEDVGTALVHIFRFRGDRIVELWDIAQAIPADSPNKNGVF